MIDKTIYNLLNSQIKTPSVKIPKTIDLLTIQDNDQSINLGAINEKYHSSLRGKTTVRTKRKRSDK